MAIEKDWMREAAEIAEGKSTIPPARQHVVCVYQNYLALCQKHETLTKLLKDVFDEIKIRRMEAGLPVMPDRPKEGKT